MSSYKNKNILDMQGGSIQMVSLADVAFLKWTKKGAELLDRKMLEAQPKKLSSRLLSRMTEDAGYPVSYQTINKMRKGETSEVTPEKLLGVCRALNLDISCFLSDPTATMKPEKYEK